MTDVQLPAKFFVYGTLKRGRSNSSLMGDSEFLSEASTDDPQVLTTVGYPYMNDTPNHEDAFPVRGEIWEVNSPEVVQQLDWLEGHPNHFRRRVRRFVGEDGSIQHAWVYQPDSDQTDLPRCEVVDGEYVY